MQQRVNKKKKHTHISMHMVVTKMKYLFIKNVNIFENLVVDAIFKNGVIKYKQIHTEIEQKFQEEKNKMNREEKLEIH